MFEQLRLDGSYETPDLVESALDADAEVTPITKMTIDPKAEPGKSSLKRAPSNPLQRRANGWSEPTGSHPLSKSMRAGSIIEPEVPLEPIRTDVENSKEELEEQSADESGAEEYTDEVCPYQSIN
jgi:ribose-phosphate pyrophosphokinase